MNEIDPAILPRAVSDGPQTGWEAMSANFSATWENDQLNSRLGSGLSYSMDAAYKKKVADIERITGQPFDWKGLPDEMVAQYSAVTASEDRLDRELPYAAFQDRIIPELTDPGGRRERFFADQVRALSDRFPAVLSVLDTSIEQTRLELKREAEVAADKAGQSPNLSTGSWLASTAGGSLTASLTDPIQIPLMALGFNVKAESVAARIALTVLSEASVNAGQTALIKVVNEGDNARANVRHGLENGIEETAMAALFGGLFGGVVRGGAEGGSGLLKIWRGKKIPPEMAERLAKNELSITDVETLADHLGVKLSDEQRRTIHRAFEEQSIDDAMRSTDAPADQALVQAAASRHAADPDGFPEPSLVEAALRDRADGGPHLLSGEEFSALLNGDREVAETFRERVGRNSSANAEQTLSVVTPAGRRFEVRPEIVDARDLVKASGNLQPRDRSRAASDAQISEIAARLDPALLMHAATSDRGAPIVGPDGVVESGNGRVAAIQLAAQAHPEKYAAYKQALRDAGFEVPETGVQVLVSRRTTLLSDADRLAFVNESNSSGIAALSATEKAGMDVHAMGNAVLAAYVPGPVNAAANRKFVATFLDNLPSNERFGLVDAHGQLNADGIRRIENAMIAAAYGEADVIARFAETPDDNVKSIMGAMSDVAGLWAGLRRDFAEGVIDADLDVTEHLTEALRLISRARETALAQKRPVATVIKEALGQLDLLTGEVDPRTRAFVQSFYKSDQFTQANGRDIIAAHLNNIVRAAQELGQPQLFGEATAISPAEMISNARTKDGQADFFGAGGAGEGGRIDGAVVDGDSRGAQDLSGAGQTDPNVDRQSGADGLSLVEDRRSFRADIPHRSIDQLFAVAGKWQAELHHFASSLAGELQLEWRNPGIKEKTRALEKMEDKGFEDASQITDIVRGSFVVDLPSQADAVAGRLAATFNALDEGWQTSFVGYTDRKILLKFSDGTIGEIQIVPKAMIDAKEGGGHALYQQMRVLEEGDQGHLELARQQKRLYSAAAAELSPEMAAAISAGNGGRSGNIRENSSSLRTYPESMTSAVLTTDQGLLLPRTAQDFIEADMMAGRPSQSKNVSDMVNPSVTNMVSRTEKVNLRDGQISEDAKQKATGIRPDHAAEPHSDAALANAEARAREIVKPAGDGLADQAGDTAAIRQDLAEKIEAGLPSEALENHPAIVSFQAEAAKIPRTNLQPGFMSEAWLQNREFNIRGEVVVGHENAAFLMDDHAGRLGWTDEGLEPPPDPVHFERKAFIVLGPPAAGKSTLANPLARKYRAMIVDSDEIKKNLPEFNDGIGADAVHEESGALADLMLLRATGEGANIVLPKVGGNAAKIVRIIDDLASDGYDVHLVNMAVDPQEAQRRMLRRFVAQGKLIPLDILREVGDNPSKTYQALKASENVKGHAEIDNNGPAGAPKPVLEDRGGILQEIFRDAGGRDAGRTLQTGRRPERGAVPEAVGGASGQEGQGGGITGPPTVAQLRPDHLAEPHSDAALANAEARAGEIVEPQIDANGNPVSLFEWLPVTDGDGNVRLVSMREALDMADEAEFHADILGACKT